MPKDHFDHSSLSGADAIERNLRVFLADDLHPSFLKALAKGLALGDIKLKELKDFALTSREVRIISSCVPDMEARRQAA